MENDDWLDTDSLDDIHVGWTSINEVAEAYQFWRRRVQSGDYNVFSEKKRSAGFQDRCRNWVHMKRAAAVIKKLHADPMEYMQAQFITATPTSYPFPNNTYSRRAVERWRSRQDYAQAEALMKMMKSYAERYPKRFDMPLEDLVYDDLLPFEDWFRVCHMERGQIPPGIARGALSRLQRDSGIRRVIAEEGYDLTQIEQNCEEALADASTA